jgi:hypothetical protein
MSGLFDGNHPFIKSFIILLLGKGVSERVDEGVEEELEEEII